MNKKFICLANSRKTSGRCLAGKEIIDNNLGGWFRPISNRATHEISEYERQYQNGSTAQTLDIITLEIKNKTAHPVQIENHLIDNGYYWVKDGSYTQSLSGLIDTPNKLWDCGDSSYYGQNDRVGLNTITNPIQSIYLIAPENLSILVRTEGAEFNNGKKKVRAKFKYNKITYLISVTDPAIERNYLAKGDGEYIIDNPCYITVSLGEIWNGYYYKLAAAIFQE